MLVKVLHKRGIALLITVFFIMAITLSVGVGLKEINSASQSRKSEQFMFQSSMILDDVLKLLKDSNELQEVNSAESLAIFLSEFSYIPFRSNGISIVIEIESARAKINPNSFSYAPRVGALKSFLMLKMVNLEYGDMMLDVIGGIKEDMSYNTDIFNQKPYLFRDYMASQRHLSELNDSYVKKYHDNSLKNIDMKELFYTSKDGNSSVDLNYATPLVWELMLGCNETRASELSVSGGAYESLEDFGLSSEEIVLLSRFQTSFFEPYIDVKVEISQRSRSANIRFEYDISSKRGSNFVYEI